MTDRFFVLVAVRAGLGVGSLDSVEVFVKGTMSGNELCCNTILFAITSKAGIDLFDDSGGMIA